MLLCLSGSLHAMHARMITMEGLDVLLVGTLEEAKPWADLAGSLV